MNDLMSLANAAKDKALNDPGLLEEIKRVRALVRAGRPQQAETDPVRAVAYEVRAANKRGMAIDQTGGEAQQGSTLDWQPATFLVEGAVKRRAVAKVDTPSMEASGFMISPRLFMTNAHVVSDEAECRGTTITFDFEKTDGGYLPTTSYQLAPETFFISSPGKGGLDYAIVAVGQKISGTGTLAEMGFCALSDSPDRHRIGMPANVIHHPVGSPKQITIRQNPVLARGADQITLWYESDTEHGSSGSPVFNDDWDLIALHHYGFPFAELRAEDGERPVHANEGIRISAIYRDLMRQMDGLAPDVRALLAEALFVPKNETGTSQHVLRPRRVLNVSGSEANPARISTNTRVESMNTMSSRYTITVPLEISLGFGGMPLAAEAQVSDPPAAHIGPVSGKVLLARAGAEGKKLDRDYSNRTGFDTNFISGQPLGLPKIGAALKPFVAPLRAQQDGSVGSVLNYEHFSVMLHGSFKMAIFTATNIDGETYINVDRTSGVAKDGGEGDTWYQDPRVSESFYLGKDWYASWSDYFDRGHLTRRTDPTWGDAATAERANLDTFHLTNCSPQHWRFNETTPYWQGVERYVLETGVLKTFGHQRIVVYQGPIFDEVNGLDAEGQLIPVEFWKVVVWVGAHGLRSVGLVVSQAGIADEVRKSNCKPKDVAFVNVNQWRVSIADIQTKTNLTFDPAIITADTFKQPQQPQVGESSVKVLIRSLEDFAAIL